MSDSLRRACADGVLSLTLDRPAKRNALDKALVAELHAAIDHAELDAGVRVVALTGAGRDFCAGADLAELLASVDRTLDENEAAALELGTLFLKFRRLPKPIVALVRGNALAGGCGLATACDLVLAAESARLGYPEIQRGFVPAMVMALLRRLVGERVAFDLVATGRLLSAAEAQALGLVSRTLADDRFDADAEQILAGLADASGTALALTKQLLYDLDGRGVEDGIRLGARVNAVARATPDFPTQVARFLQR
ncbi:MAG TPA: enoyl-CoA hydratase/isomerase family protein [Gemmatimonadales bacterium]|nr:enoyl-CoA hydratase/isomerase family protein [Gemmatimonadales bacterium]